MIPISWLVEFDLMAQGQPLDMLRDEEKVNIK